MRVNLNLTMDKYEMNGIRFMPNLARKLRLAFLHVWNAIPPGEGTVGEGVTPV